MIVRSCRHDDLIGLEAVFPLGAGAHERRLQGQQQGRWLYLLALDPTPSGSCLVRWDGSSLLDVRERLPHVVEIAHLQVAGTARGRGCGRALVAEAERQAGRRQRAVIGLGVADDNPGARRLYEQLGYGESGIRYRVDYEYLDPAGTSVPTTEAGDFLVKDLLTA